MCNQTGINLHALQEGMKVLARGLIVLLFIQVTVGVRRNGSFAKFMETSRQTGGHA